MAKVVNFLPLNVKVSDYSPHGHDCFFFLQLEDFTEYKGNENSQKMYNECRFHRDLHDRRLQA